MITASSAQVRRPLYRTSLQRWQPRQTLLAPLLDALGPELVSAGRLNERATGAVTQRAEPDAKGES
ncbi:hypothetical protein PQR02_14005 [Paraburkholderia sediminicola]|uniref:Uncharacterized protein n=1 Tax=Paraburkholderia rhynchosiae TaxID=487049 RepID=A0ACC7NH19_9BURK